MEQTQIRCFIDKYSILMASDKGSIQFATDRGMKEILNTIKK